VLISINSDRQLSTEADDGNRTRNLPLTRRLLCRLSYVGKLKRTFCKAKGIIPEGTLRDKVIQHAGAESIRILGYRQWYEPVKFHSAND
jgi:hypothetical protein